MNNHHENRISWKTSGINLPVSFGYGEMAAKVICLARAVFVNQFEFIKNRA